MEAIIVNLTGAILIGLTIWWFLIAKPKARTVSHEIIDILVHDGVYEPSVIKTKQNKFLKLRFLRKDNSPCSEHVIFDKLNISAQLPYNKSCIISIPISQAGEYDFMCQMGMYKGRLIVE